MEKAFDHINSIDLHLANIQKHPAYQRCVENGQRRGANARVRFGSISPSSLRFSLGENAAGYSNAASPVLKLEHPLSSLHLRPAIAMAPATPMFDDHPFEGETICTSIAIAIRDLTPEYKAARDSYLAAVQEYLDALSTAVSTSSNDPYTVAAVVEASAAEARAFVNFEFVAVQMGVLVAMWDVNNCWNDPEWTPTGTGVVGNLGGVTVTCHMEWVTLEESVDGGTTWHVIWEGYATICE